MFSKLYRNNFFLPIILVLLVAAAYANSLHAPFVFDDSNHIKENPRIHKLWPIADVMAATNRPVTDLTLAVNYRLGKLAVTGYHIFNLAVHILNALLVMAIVSRALVSPRVKENISKNAAMLSFFAALLWALHPIQTQSVTYIIQRSELLMGLFYLLTLYCVIRSHRNPKAGGWGIAAILFCALGMGSKEVMVTAPIVILLYDRIFLSASYKEIVKKRGWVYLGLAATWFLLFKFATAQRANAAIGGFSFDLVAPWEYAVSQPKVICHYIKLMFWPKGLCLDYQWPLAKTAGDIVPYAAVIISFICATVWALLRRPAWGFLGVWFFFILGPTSSFMPIGDLAFEQRMYLSSLSVIVIFVLGIDGSLRRLKSSPKAITRWGVFILVAAALFFLTMQRNVVYRDDESLWRDVLNKRPENMRAYQNLGVALLRKGKNLEAESYLQKALDLNPINEKAHLNLASILEQRGDLLEAKEHLNDAIKLNPDFFYAYLLTGRILMEEKDFAQAGQYLERAVTLAPENMTAHLYLGFLRFKTGRLEEAMREYGVALELDPGNTEIYYHAALALAQQGDLDKAAQYFAQVTDRDPTNALAHFNLGNILAQQGDYRSAQIHFQECLRLKPEFAPAQQRIEQVRSIIRDTP